MATLITGLLLGLAAAVIDVTPMLMMRLNKFACASAFTHWIVLGIFITYMNIPVFPWLQGLLVGFLASLPVIIGLLKDDPKSVPIVLVTSLVLGTLLGIATAKWA